MTSITPLQKKRFSYLLKVPKILTDLNSLTFKEDEKTSALKDALTLQKYFPRTYGRPIMKSLKKTSHKNSRALRVGVVFSGGQASGGHNVIIGLFEALKENHRESQLFGFLNGPIGIIEGECTELLEKNLSLYRNQGGFDLIGSGRTKIETKEQFSKVLRVLERLNLDGLVIIGGDDSNTNAALLAEYLLEHQCKTVVVGVPKTIDGDLKNDEVAISFGFDTACRTYCEMIGNIARDALSAKKYTHFIKLMGRSASHIALECALQTQPNCTLIGEEVAKKGQSLKEIASDLTNLVKKRALSGKNYGVILIPEGLIEFTSEMKNLIKELNALLAAKKDPVKQLSLKAKEVLDFLPKPIQTQLLLDRDPHGNVQVSHIQTEALLSHVVKTRLQEEKGGKPFNPVHHFLGYEGRAGFPSNFDATYCYSLGRLSAVLIREGLSGYMSCIQGLEKLPLEWEVCALPLTSLMNIELRKGKEKPVIQKALVDLEGKPFKKFAKARHSWEVEDHYRYLGPIQFEGDFSWQDQVPLSLID